MSAFRSPPSANNPERAPCFTPTDGAARRGPPRCAENCDPFLLISSHSTPEHALARGGRNLASPHLLNRQGCTGWPASGLRSAYAGGSWPPLSSWRLPYPPLPLGGVRACCARGGEGVRRAGVRPSFLRRQEPRSPSFPRRPQVIPGWPAPKCAKVGHATPACVPEPGPVPRSSCPREWRCAIVNDRPAYVAMGRPR